MGKRIDYPPLEEAQEIIKRAGIKLRKEYALKYKELGLPSDPRVYYREKGWTDWETFLGKTEQFPSYDEARELVLKKGISSRRMYDSVYKELGLPSAPYRTYKDKGWIDWDSFLGKEKFPPYEEAQKIVQERGIKDKEEYLSVYKELGLPAAPQRTYKDKGWIKWDYFLGKYPTFEEAKAIIKESNIKSKREYESSYKELGLPSDPRTYYKEEGWTSWSDLWRELYGYTTDKRKYNILKKLSITPALLMEDAPLKIIYIFVSKFNEELAKEIGSLLGTSSYEERLNWVKKQLKGLKESSLSKAKSSIETTSGELSSVEDTEDYEGDYDGSPIEDQSEDYEGLIEDFSDNSFEEAPDELSAMESIVRDNADVIESLSDEDIEKFNRSWENYVHSVINRELIAEYDG